MQESFEPEEIETDRDSFTFATTTVARRRTMVETSYSFIDNRIGPESHSYPELLVRHGMAEWFEVRLGWNFESGGPGTVSGTEVGGEDLEVENEGRMLYGAKFQTTLAGGWVPESALMVQGFTPTSGETTASTLNIGEAWGWTFANGWVWNSAMRFATANENQDDFVQWAPSTVLKIPIGRWWNVHAEYFGIFSSGRDEAQLNLQFASFGGHVLLTPDLELGVRVGVGLNDGTPGFFSNVGVGWQF